MGERLIAHVLFWMQVYAPEGHVGHLEANVVVVYLGTNDNL
jgi:hypothetical protein